MLLLDTCTLIWLASDLDKLSGIAKNAIRRHAEELFVSAISAFEIAVKCRNGKLLLPQSPSEWFPGVIEFHGIREIPVSAAIAISSINLPQLHNDPCDRMIIATAQLHTMKIVTCDNLIRAYKEAVVVW